MSKLGQNTRSDEVAKDLLAKIQGVIIIANVYNDADFLHRGIKDIQSWLNQTLGN